MKIAFLHTIVAATRLSIRQLSPKASLLPPDITALRPLYPALTSSLRRHSRKQSGILTDMDCFAVLRPATTGSLGNSNTLLYKMSKNSYIPSTEYEFNLWTKNLASVVGQKGTLWPVPSTQTGIIPLSQGKCPQSESMFLLKNNKQK